MILINGVKVEFEKFPNGETKLVYDDLLQIENKGVISFKYESDEDLIKLVFLKNYLDGLYPDISNYYSLYIYYMPYSRMDRSEQNSPLTLKYVANLINSLNFEDVVIAEPHSNVTPALVNNARVFNVTELLLEKVINYLELDLNDNDYIMFPDYGALNRYKNLQYKNVLIGHKIRDFETGKIKSLEVLGKVNKGSNRVIILDDLSSYGGTFVEASKALRKKGFKEVNLFVGHAENSIFKGKLFDYIDKLITTNSILTEQDNWENKKYKDKLMILNMEDIWKSL